MNFLAANTLNIHQGKQARTLYIILEHLEFCDVS